MRNLKSKKEFIYYLNDYEIRNIAQGFMDDDGILRIKNIYEFTQVIGYDLYITKGMREFINNVLTCLNAGYIKIDDEFIYLDKFKERKKNIW